MARIAAFCDIMQIRLIGAVGGATLQNETPIAITAINIAMFINLKIDARMPQCSGAISCTAANGAGAVATDAASADQQSFRRVRVHVLSG